MVAFCLFLMLLFLFLIFLFFCERSELLINAASTVHAAVRSVWLTEILPASDSELRSHMFL